MSSRHVALLEQSKLHTTFLVMLTGLIVVVNSRVLCLAIQVVLLQSFLSR